MKSKIMLVIDSLQGGGAERVTVDILRHLDRDRFIPSVCITRGGGGISVLDGLDIPVYRLERRGRFDLRGFISLLKAIGDERPDIVHTQKFGSNGLGRIAAILERTPVIIAHEHTMPDRTCLQAVVDNLLSRRTDLIITCDGALRESLLTREKLAPSKVEVIHNGIDLEYFQKPGRTREEILRGLDLPPGPLVGTFARLEPQKDIGNLLQAIPVVLEAFEDAHFLVAGRGPLEEQLKTRANDMGLSGHISFLGFRNDMPDLLSVIDVFTLSSIWEGFPLTLLEAMAAGKPVVCTDVGGVREIIDHGINGLLVPPGDPVALGGAIKRLLGSPDMAGRLGIGGKRLVEKDFSIQAMIGNLEKKYLELLARKKHVHPGQDREEA